MCLAIPGRVVEVENGTAIVEMEGKRSRVSLNLLADDEHPIIGDFLICHLGMALQKIDEAEANELMEMIQQVAGWPGMEETETELEEAAR